MNTLSFGFYDSHLVLKINIACLFFVLALLSIIDILYSYGIVALKSKLGIMFSLQQG